MNRKLAIHPYVLLCHTEGVFTVDIDMSVLAALITSMDLVIEQLGRTDTCS